MQIFEVDGFPRPRARLGEKDGGARVLVAGLGPEGGLLEVWKFGQKVTSDTVATCPPRGTVHFVPDAVAPVSAKADGVPKHVAVILRPTADGDNQLALIDLEDGKVVARVPLVGSDRVNFPVLAAVPPAPF